MNFIKNKHRTGLTDEHLQNSLRVAASGYTPNTTHWWTAHRIQHTGEQHANAKMQFSLTEKETGQFELFYEPAYYIFVPRFQTKNSSFRLPYQHHNSSADCARELFNGSKRLASLLDQGWGTYSSWARCGSFDDDICFAYLTRLLRMKLFCNFPTKLLATPCSTRSRINSKKHVNKEKIQKFTIVLLLLKNAHVS